MLEREIEAHLCKRVRELGGEVRKVNWVGRHSAPDRIAMLPGRTLWVELKRPGQKANPAQKREHERMRALGQVVFVVDSIEGVEEVLA
jgi:hypothetical protein